MIHLIVKELKHHAPFTVFGAVTGVIFMMLFRQLDAHVSHTLFYVFHPCHVVLSALVTAAMYRQYKCRLDRKQCNLFFLLVIGYVGSIGIATLSDSLIPYWGETLLDMPDRHMHIGFIEKWWIISPLALLGVGIAYFKPSTKFPHYGHVLLSTWASLFHVLAAAGGQMSWAIAVPVFIFLFIAVWVPCCVSDIIFPLLFVRDPEHIVHH